MGSLLILFKIVKVKYHIILILFCAVFLNHIMAQKKNLNLIASATPEATEAGTLIFNKDGNAVDAAVAIAFTLGVTEPAMPGIGGRTMLILSIPNQEPVAIGGISLTPSKRDIDLKKKGLTFYKQVSIPSQVKILNCVWKKYGSGNLEWKELLQPAIHYSENGFVNGLHRQYGFKIDQQELKDNCYHNRELLIDNGILAIGDLVKQPTLAKTLTRLSIYRADDFYEGEIAKEIAEDFKSNNGWISDEDLSNFPEHKELKALHVNYSGYHVYSFTPPGGEWQVLQALNLFEQYDTKKIKPNTLESTMAVLNVLNISHKDRLDNAIKNYNNFQLEIAQKISKKYAKTLYSNANEISKIDASIKENEAGETTHFSVVDKKGIAVSVTSSIGSYFGSKTSTKNVGFFYNSYLKSLVGFGFGKSVKPKTIIPSSMSPSLVRKSGKNALVIGTLGSKRIVSTISQLIQLWIDSDIDIKDIIKQPQVHAIGDLATIEDESLTSNELQKIGDKGFKIAFPSYNLTNKSGLNVYFGGNHAIEFKNGEWTAAADPRRDGSTN